MPASTSIPSRRRTLSNLPVENLQEFKDCPLSDESIGIISENDHKVGLCLCKYCECGLHICPGQKPDLTMRSTFKTKYSYDYKHTGFDSPLRQDQKRYQPNTLKMDFQTTNQHDYKPFIVSPKQENPPPTSPTKVNFNSRTAYNNDFPNWGSSTPHYEKRFHPPVRSVEIPFRGDSSYKQSFRPVTRDEADFYKTDYTNSVAFNSTLTLAPKDKLNSSTTYADNMKDFSYMPINTRIKVKAESPIKVEPVHSHFRTTSGSFFQNAKQESKDPRLMRLSLMSRAGIRIGKA